MVSDEHEKQLKTKSPPLFSYEVASVARSELMQKNNLYDKQDEDDEDGIQQKSSPLLSEQESTYCGINLNLPILLCTFCLIGTVISTSATTSLTTTTPFVTRTQASTRKILFLTNLSTIGWDDQSRVHIIHIGAQDRTQKLQNVLGSDELNAIMASEDKRLNEVLNTFSISPKPKNLFLAKRALHI